MQDGFEKSTRARRRVAALGLGAALLVAGCGGNFAGTEPVENVDREVVQGLRTEQPSTLGDLFQQGREQEELGQAIAVNRFLWLASLDTLSFLPLASTDPFSGVIATDWAAVAGTADERYKVTVYVTNPRLEASSLRVAVFREVRRGEGWASAEVSETTPRRIEDAILSRARQLRVASLEAEQG